MHIFPYSIRPGTVAASMPGQLDKAVKNARAREAQKAAAEMRDEYLGSMLGKTLSVLFETESGGVWTGHSENYCEVTAIGENLHGIVKCVSIKSFNKGKLSGIII